MLQAEGLLVAAKFVNSVVCKLLTAIIAAKIDKHAHGCRGEKAIHVEAWWRDALEHIDGLDQNGRRVDAWIFPDYDRTVALFRAEREINRAADHGVVPGQKANIFAPKCSSAVASHSGPLLGQAGEGISEQLPRCKTESTCIDVVDSHAEVIEDAVHKLVERAVGIEGANLPDELRGGFFAEGVQRDEAILPLAELLF